MKFSATFSLLSTLVAVTLAAVTPLTTNMAAIAKQAEAVNTELAKKDNTLEGFTAVYGETKKLSALISKGIEAAKAQPTFVPDAEAKTISDALAATLKSVESANTAVIAAKPDLQKMGLADQVHDGMEKSSDLTKAFDKELAAKIPAKELKAVQASQEKIEASQAQAIAAYAS